VEGTDVIVAGVDEAGRGPIAGPVMTAAVILTPAQFHVLLSEGLADSKKLSERARERLFARMSELGVVWAAQAASHRRIDGTNILASTLWAMRRALLSLTAVPDLVVVDGVIAIPDVSLRQITLPKADSKVPAVMAASVAAKVLRDRAMRSLHRLYPDYGFDRHKGYPTAAHRAVLDMLGPSPVHRLSFGGYSKTARGGV
jgi:ribonuclease HII